MLRSHRVDLARPEPWVQRGTVDAPRPGVGTVIVDGWLAGMRSVVSGFTLRATHGALVIPPGVGLVAPVPASTTTAAPGEPTTVIAHGDHVMVSGFVAAPGDGPFRAAAVVPGPDGLVVSRPRQPHETVDRDVLLVLYRPCLLFLVIAAIAALPGIIRYSSAIMDPTAFWLEH